MAKLFLDSTDDAVVSITGNNYTVFGFAGKTVSVAAGVTGLNLKSSVEAVKFSGNLSDYTFLQTGTSVVVKNAAGVTVSTIAVQSDADGSSLAFANGTYAVKTVAPATAGALSTITFGGATINNADAATNNTAAAAPATATANAGTAVTNALPVLTVPTTAASVIIGSTSDSVSGISFTDADDNTGFTVTLKATGTSALSATGTTGAALKNAAGTVLQNDEPSSTLVVTGSKAAVNTVIGSLKYITNASAATSEAVTVTVTDAKGGSATGTAPIAVVKQLALATSAPTASLIGTANDDNITGTFTQFNTYTTYSVVGGGGNDKLVLTGVSGPLNGLVSAIKTADLTLTDNSSLTVDTTHFGSTLSNITVNANSTASKSLTFNTVNAGSVFNINKTFGTLTLTAINGTAGTSDAFTVNLGGGVTAATVTGGASIIDSLTINSNGTDTQTNAVTVGTLTTNASVTVAGSQELNLGTLPNLGTGVFDASAATGKIIVTAAAADSASITGGSAGDALTGGTSNDTISGGSGDDTITGNAGLNVLSGDAGNDTISGGAVSDTINGGDGADVITGGGASDVLNGDAGNDKITGSDGNDTINGGEGNDTIIGNGGTDTLLGGAGNDSITGGTGADVITGGAGADTLTGGTGIDTFVFNVGDSLSSSYDTITDLAKGDKIKIGDFGITGLTSGSAIPTSASSATAKEIYMDSTNKFLVIETSADGSTVEKIAIQGASANAPFIYNNNGTASDLTDDFLTVGATSLASTVAAGKLSFTGEAGGVTTLALALGGATVNSVAVPGGYVTSIDASNLTAAGGASGIKMAVTQANGTYASLLDTKTDIASAFTIIGSDLNDTLYGAAGADSINGGLGVDSITGNDGADTILGGAGEDIIDGGSGADRLTGGTGADQIDGGTDTGIDTFVFNSGDGVAASAVDTSTHAITFTNGVDIITHFGSVGNSTSNTYGVDVMLFNGTSYDGSSFVAGAYDGTSGKVNNAASIYANGTSGSAGLYYLQGAYDTSTKVFTPGTAGTDNDFAIFNNATAGVIDLTGISDIVIHYIA